MYPIKVLYTLNLQTWYVNYISIKRSRIMWCDSLSSKYFFSSYYIGWILVYTISPIPCKYKKAKAKEKRSFAASVSHTAWWLHLLFMGFEHKWIPARVIKAYSVLSSPPLLWSLFLDHAWHSFIIISIHSSALQLLSHVKANSEKKKNSNRFYKHPLVYLYPIC